MSPYVAGKRIEVNVYLRVLDAHDLFILEYLVRHSGMEIRAKLDHF